MSKYICTLGVSVSVYLRVESVLGKTDLLNVLGEDHCRLFSSFNGAFFVHLFLFLVVSFLCVKNHHNKECVSVYLRGESRLRKTDLLNFLAVDDCGFCNVMLSRAFFVHVAVSCSGVPNENFAGFLQVARFLAFIGTPWPFAERSKYCRDGGFVVTITHHSLGGERIVFNDWNGSTIGSGIDQRSTLSFDLMPFLA